MKFPRLGNPFRRDRNVNDSREHLSFHGWILARAEERVAREAAARTRTLLKWLFAVGILALIFFALTACKATAIDNIQARAPFQTVIISDSMVPLLQVADVVEVVPADYDQLKAGQIIAYRPYFSRSPFNYVHQLKKKRVLINGKVAWVVQGINNPKPDDSFLTRQNFVGVVTLTKKACKP